MRNSINILLVAIVCCIVSLFLSGCRKKADTNDSQYGYVSFSIDWKESLTPYVTGLETLRFCFYTLGDGPMIQYEADTSAFKMVLPPDKYGLLVYSPKEGIQLRSGNNFDDAQLFLSPTLGNSTMSLCSHLYGMVVDSLSISPNQNGKITVSPILLSKQIHFNIIFEEKEKKRIKEYSATLHNINTTIDVDKKKIAPSGRISIPLVLNKKNNTLYANTYILSATYNETEILSPQLELLVTLNDGMTLLSTVDLGTSLYNYKEPEIDIEIEASFAKNLKSTILLNCKSIQPSSQINRGK